MSNEPNADRPKPNRDPSRLDNVKRYASDAHKDMLDLQELGKERALTPQETTDLNDAREMFNALSSCIGLANSVNQWRLNEVRPRLVRVTPLQRKILAQHKSLNRRPVTELSNKEVH
jgi:hypothetical protein